MLNYFQKLPPDTLNVESASSGLTSRETEEVSKELKKVQGKGKKRKNYCVWTTQQRLEIGEHAAKSGNASTLRFLSSKYPRLTKQSITEFKKAYNEGKRKCADLSEGILMKSRGDIYPKSLEQRGEK